MHVGEISGFATPNSKQIVAMLVVVIPNVRAASLHVEGDESMLYRSPFRTMTGLLLIAEVVELRLSLSRKAIILRQAHD